MTAITDTTADLTARIDPLSLPVGSQVTYRDFVAGSHEDEASRTVLELSEGFAGREISPIQSLFGLARYPEGVGQAIDEAQIDRSDIFFEIVGSTNGKFETIRPDHDLVVDGNVPSSAKTAAPDAVGDVSGYWVATWAVQPPHDEEEGVSLSDIVFTRVL